MMDAYYHNPYHDGWMMVEKNMVVIIEKNGYYIVKWKMDGQMEHVYILELPHSLHELPFGKLI